MQDKLHSEAKQIPQAGIRSISIFNPFLKVIPISYQNSGRATGVKKIISTKLLETKSKRAPFIRFEGDRK
jgi:hypothetical protein